VLNEHLISLFIKGFVNARKMPQSGIIELKATPSLP
jgi:hypothetical protein